MSDRTGLLILRVWIEDGSPEPLRAHLRISSDVSTGFERSLVLSRTDEVCTTVHGWLADLLREPVGSGPAGLADARRLGWSAGRSGVVGPAPIGPGTASRAHRRGRRSGCP